MYPYMEAPHPSYPPEYDEPETTKSEVLDVIYGRSLRDGLGRDWDDLMGDTSMQAWASQIADDMDAEQELMALIGRHSHESPRVRAILEELAESAAKQTPVWSHS